MNTKRARTGRTLGTLILLAVVVTGTAHAGANRSCATGFVPATFVLPDGSVHLPGTLTLCADRRLNPVQRLERIVVSGIPQGLFVAREFDSEARGARPYLTFHRAAGGEWILVGLTLPSSEAGGPPRTARFADDERVAELAMRRGGDRPMPIAPTGVDPRVILVAEVD